ncbi:MAG: zinc-ribbon domain containing protein [Bacillota bacterium]|jgi:hypothetical protein
MKDCGAYFVFTVGEQELYKEKVLIMSPFITRIAAEQIKEKEIKI